MEILGQKECLNMMSHHFGLSLVLIAAALGAKAAKADPIDLTTYTINFTGTGLLPTAGSFTYDPDTPNFTSFSVTYDGLIFDLTSSANAPNLQGSLPGCLTGKAGAEATFALLTDCTPPPTGYTHQWYAIIKFSLLNFSFQDTDTGGNGIFINTIDTTATPIFSTGGFSAAPATTVPEPTSLMPATLLLCALVARKRLVQGIRQATRTNQ